VEDSSTGAGGGDQGTRKRTRRAKTLKEEFRLFERVFRGEALTLYYDPEVRDNFICMESNGWHIHLWEHDLSGENEAFGRFVKEACTPKQQKALAPFMVRWRLEGKL
jgi:hypothetical protein